MVAEYITKANNFFERLKKGAALNMMVNIIQSLGLSFGSYYFLNRHLAFYKIILVWAINPFAAMLVVLLVNNWNTRRFLRLGTLAYAGMALSLVFYSQYSWVLFGAFSGLVYGFFWTSFNYIFFSVSVKNQHAKDSSLYFMFPSIANVLIAPIGALIIGAAGFKVLFLITAGLCLIPFFYIRGQYFDYSQEITFRKSDKDLSGIRLIKALDGVLHFFQWHFLTIYMLLFLKTQYQVGGMLSYLALLSLLVSFALSYASDKYNKRVEFLYPLLTLMAILILIMPSMHSLALLVPIIGLYAILDNLSMPIRLAVSIDMGTKDIGFWRASEFYGSMGRAIMFGVAGLLLYLGNYWLPFAIFSLTTLVTPFIIRHKLKQTEYRQLGAGESAELVT